jgi:heme oxygenase
MLTQLDLEMQIHLAEVDADPLAVIASPERDRYREFLIRSYGFEASVESALAMTPNLDLVIDLRQRAKAGLVAADLLALGVRPQELSQVPLCTSVETFETIVDAMGWLYVVERRALLHTAIIKDLTPRMPEVMAVASSYLHCYDRNAGTRWRDLSRAFDRVATPEASGKIVAAAHRAFSCQREWFRVIHASSATG